jgi:Transposase IS116/IS110/IS902 family
MRRSGEKIASIDFEASLVSQEYAWARLRYVDDGQLMDYRVQIQASPCHYGGMRWWWVCPLSGQCVAAGQATFLSLISLLCSVPGINGLGATIILAEIGRDMCRFPTAGHLVAWAGMCPGQNESAGKRKSSRLRKGAPWLKTILVQCAWAATRKKDSYYGAQFRRLRPKRGPKKAICAVAASMLTAIYHMLKDGTHHQDLGADHFDRRSSEAKSQASRGSTRQAGLRRRTTTRCSGGLNAVREYPTKQRGVTS